MADNEIEKIEPVEFDVSKSPLFSDQPAPTINNKPTPMVWLGLGALFVIALAVIFVLPSVVTEYELPLERRVEVADAVSPSQPATRSQVNAVSPFEEAQRSIQRKEAQDMLAELLTLQAQLDEMQVERWAPGDYADALDFARIGDEDYLEQQFIEARDNYETGKLQLQDLLDRVPTTLEQHLIDGEAALAANQSDQAREKFSIALALEPGNSQAQVGLDRAESLDEVNNLLSQADDLVAGGELEPARELYLSALDLDQHNTLAREQLESVNRQILENQFAQIMSQGYSLLQDNQPEQAIETFQRAATMGINQDQAQAAIQQTLDAVARVEIDRLRNEAEDAVDAEQWQLAVESYASVLEVDANIIFAQEGLDYTEKRLRLDQLLEYAIANPERLAEDTVYQQTLDIYYTGQALEDNGPRLAGQLQRLQVILDESQVLHEVRLVSDNETQVTLLRIAEIGVFENHNVSLKPGRYTAVGVREGYRDVRQEFVVGFGQTPETVVIQCDERIVASRGR